MAFGWFKRNRSAQAEPQPTQQATKPSDAATETRRDDPAATTRAAAPAAPVTFPPEKIAARAYEIWVRKGKPHGAELQNWLDAEVELRAEFAANPEPGAPIRKPR
jgi:hypothetical protein